MVCYLKNSIAFFILIILTLCSSPASPQDSNPSADNKTPLTESISSETITKAVEKAIKETEAEKEKKSIQLNAHLRSRLDQAISEWIRQARQIKSKDLNKLLHENWKNIVTVTLPIPNDYYLRSYEYFVIKEECVKSDSIISPYTAAVVITEKLYVEGYHSPGISNVSPYLYTIVRPITINLKYSQDDFIVTSTEFGPLDISSGWDKQ
ncbi:MAG: hypothetical protein HY761_02600 [Candidatus Omnitrophica bacterium]|nr:hypothetical protein [Candidatus Omnitrophota bacterium]